MKIIDISMPIHENMAVYKNIEEKKPRITFTSSLSTGGSYESEICMSLHSGTHIDMPLHMIENGENSNKHDLSGYISECTVLDFTDLKDKISDTHLKEKNIQTGDFILFKTKNSFTESFDFEFIYLDSAGAEYLKELKVKGVGTDALGIERAQPGHETHKILFQNSIIIIEGLRLKSVDAGRYKMIALPLNIKNVEALPARVILTEI